MRPIEFRGKVTCSIKELEEIGIKHTNGWIYGSYIDGFIIDGVVEANTEYITIEKWCAVDSKTVGQYTNVNTPSGKKIFEGDIVKVTGDEDCEFTSIVEYFGEGDYPGFDMTAPEDYYFESNKFSEILMSSSYELEVIGNIHENPELMGEATC
ncbi:hypothetical protein CT172_11360 [Listeria monocytogenes]|nr:hypothetical protein [Listeria monocytogenes]EAG5276062.1 hypothetical protein [Listeria monocytogenes]